MSTPLNALVNDDDETVMHKLPHKNTIANYLKAKVLSYKKSLTTSDKFNKRMNHLNNLKKVDERSSDGGSSFDGLPGLTRVVEIKKDIANTVETLKHQKYIMFGLKPDKFETDMLNYCYEVEDEIEIGNAND